MDRSVLPRDVEALLAEIAPHEADVGYFDERFDSVGYKQAWKEVEILEELEDLRMIELVGDRRERYWPIDGRSQKGIRYRSGFVLSHRGREYLSDAPKLKMMRLLRGLFETVAFLGSVAAIVNLILYVIWR